MRLRSGVIFALTAAVSLGGCAAAAAGGGGPLTSPTGKVYEPGTLPSQTSFSRDATLALATGQFEQALDHARQGMAADTANAMHFYLGGEAAVGVGDFELADSLWIEAERLYPAYEIDIEPSRETAWANAFNEGVEAYNAGDTAEAIRHWRNADVIFRLRPEAAQNLATMLMQEGDYDEAIVAFRRGIEAIDFVPATRVIEEEERLQREATRTEMRQALVQLLLFTDQFAEAEQVLRVIVAADPADVEAQANLANALSRLGRDSEASQIYSRLLSTPNLPATELFSIGVALFQSDDYDRAAEAFGRVTQIQPEHRDAWFNQANAIYASEDWEALVPSAERLIQIDPLNSTGALILVRAYRELQRNQEALQTLEALEAAPVLLEELQVQPGVQTTTLRGEVVGNSAAPGTPIQLRFTFFDDNGQVGTSTVTLAAPAREAREGFEVSVNAQANAYKYELVM